MSTRCNVVICSELAPAIEPVYLFALDGYLEGVGLDLLNFVNDLKKKGDKPGDIIVHPNTIASRLTARVLPSPFGGIGLDDLLYELVSGIGEFIEFMYVIESTTLEVHVYSSSEFNDQVGRRNFQEAVLYHRVNGGTARTRLKNVIARHR